MAPAMTSRIVALLIGLMLWTGTTVTAHADSRLLHPSPRALAAADDDEPPPHRTGREEKKEVKAAPAEEAPLYKKWWFWALTAAVVGGVVVAGVTTFKPAEHHPNACPPEVQACFGDGRAP
jgi:hypothetical protein